MARRIFEFRCKPCALTFDELVDDKIHEAPCPKCQQNAERIISAVRIDRLRMGAQRYASPESIDYFDRVHRQQRAKEDKAKAEHGDYGPAPGA